MVPLLLKVGLVLHAVSAGVLTGSITHLAIVLLRARQGRGNPRLLRLYPSVALGAWAVTFALGAVIYPTYRVRVRGAFLDALHPRLSVLFDVKENVAVMVFPLLLAVWITTRAAKPGDPPGTVATTSGWLSAAAVWFNLLTGLLVTSVRSV